MTLWSKATGYSGAIALSLTLSMCQSGATVTDTFCQVYEPVCLSRQDTQETQNQVLRNEAAHHELCPVEAEAVTCGGT